MTLFFQVWIRHRTKLLIVFLILTSCIHISEEEPGIDTQHLYTDTQDSALDSYIAFVSDRRVLGNNDIWLVRPDGSGMTLVTSDEMQDSNPVWSPDGRKLAFISKRIDNATFIRIYDLATSTIIQEIAVPNIMRLNWGAQGNNLVYHQIDATTGQIRTLMTDFEDGGQVVDLTGEKAYVDPQGQFVSYTISDQLDQRTGSIQLGVETNDGTNIPINYLDNKRLGVVGVGWSLDGTHFAVSYGVLARSGSPGFSVFEVDDMQVTEVAAIHDFDNKWGGVPVYCPPVWSPTKDLLVYTIGTQGTEVTCAGPLVISPSTLSDLVTVEEIEAVIGSNPWSPNGNQLVVASFPGVPLLWLEQGHEGELRSKYKSTIWIVDSNGTNLQILIDADGYNGEPAWQPKP